MKDYLIEMHAHTSEVSPCAFVCADKVVEIYKSEGYNGVVVTNHMCKRTFRDISNATWMEKMDYFLQGFKIASNYSDNDFSVLLGMEICFSNEINDYLVYGIDEEFLYKNQDMMDIGLKRFKALAEKNNLLVFQAHPFRKRMQIADFNHLDGIEVYNGNSSHNSNNDVSMFWAEKYGLKKVSGSDFHNYFGMHPGGIYFPEPVKTNAELIKALRKNEYKLR